MKTSNVLAIALVSVFTLISAGNSMAWQNSPKMHKPIVKKHVMSHYNHCKGGNTATADQYGHQNSTQIQMKGCRNNTNVMQSGAYNDAQVNVKGKYNNSNVRQHGYFNGATVYQSGKFNRAGVSQHGCPRQGWPGRS